MELRYILGDVFTDRPFGGNQLAVFPDASGLGESLMRQIAQEMNLSETVFVLPPENSQNARRVRIFTPGMELPFAGHPTIGTAALLFHHGIIHEKQIVLEEGVGPVKVTIDDSDALFRARLLMTRPHEWRELGVTADRLAAMLGLEKEEIGVAGHAPASFSAGVPFACIPVKNRQALGKARLDVQLWQTLLAQSWSPHVYVFTPDAELAGSTIRSRMFSPAMDISEDPATGAAAAAIIPFLIRMLNAGDGVHRWRIEQGFEMGRPSLIDLEADITSGKIASYAVGGMTVPMGEGKLILP